MKKTEWEEGLRRTGTLLLVCIILVMTLAIPVFAVHTYYWPDAISPDAMEIKNWTWIAEGEKSAESQYGLTPTGLSQQETALMGGYTSKFWFQNEKGRTIPIPGTETELDFTKFHHRYFACADSHNTGFFAPVGAQIALKKMYYPTDNPADYPDFIKNAPADMETKKFMLLLLSMISAAYETPSTEDLRDSDRSSIYYYLLWASIWSNDKYVDQGMFQGNSPEEDWDFVQYFVRSMLQSRLDPDPYGSTAVYDAFRDGGPAQTYFFNCWKAAKFLSSFDYTTAVGSSLPVSQPTLGDDGMYHMSFSYGELSEYEKEIYRRLIADNLAEGWEYVNDGTVIDFKSADGKGNGQAVAVLKLQENSEEDHFYNCGFGIGGLAGFQSCAKSKKTGEFHWGNTQVYFSAVSEPLEILVGGGAVPPANGDLGIEVHRYEHTETWEAHYQVQLRKLDSETGQPLKGSKWDILEAFDSGQLDDTELESSENWANRGGSQFQKWEGWDYGDGNPDGDAANDPCPWDINVTNEEGILMLGDNEENASERKAHTDIKTYTYTKGYCGGHPAPEVEESGDPEVDAQNAEAAQEAWQEEVDRCEALVEQGGFFHSIDPEEAKTQLEEDRDEYYRQFIALTYEYSAVEVSPRPGYTLHGVHTDDIPAEIKTVTSSEYKASNRGTDLSYSKAKERNLNSLRLMQPLQLEAVREDGASETKNDVPAGGTPGGADLILGNFPSEGCPESEPVLSELNVSSSNISSTYASGSNASGSNASESNAVLPNASSSNAEKRSGLLSMLKALFEGPKKLIHRLADAASSAGEGELVTERLEPSEIAPVEPGNGDLIDHTFIVYDHRTEGEVHMNKRDLYLKKGENNDYDAYGDSMGDGTLEGAVYGLFALTDIDHPDGHTGTVYQKDDLVAVAATDRNGDASFLAFTEAPGMTWNYKAGRIEKRPAEFEGPSNLHRNQTEADRVWDNESYIGFDFSGHPEKLTDSVSGPGDGYRKCSSNQSGIEGLEGTHASYPISNNEDENGNCWIGRPLIAAESGTTYYIKELSRSEGYELSVNGKSNTITNGKDNYEGEYQAAEVEIGKISFDTQKNGNYFAVTARGVVHDIVLQGIDFPEGASFALSTTKRVPEKLVVPVYSTETKPVMAAAGTFVYRDGQRVEASIGDAVTFPGGKELTVNAVSNREDRTIGIKPQNYHTMGIPAVTDLDSGGDAASFQDLYNQALEAQGYGEPEPSAPWVRVKLSGTDDIEWIASVTEAIRKYDLSYFNRLRITEIERSEEALYAVMRYEWRLYEDHRDDAVYIPSKDRLYIKKNSGNGYFVYAAYDNLENNSAVRSYTMKNGFLERAVVKDQSVTDLHVTYPNPLPAAISLITNQTPSYWVYATGEQQIDDDGNLKYMEETRVEYVEQEGMKEVEETTRLESEYDDDRNVYKITVPADAFQGADTVTVKVSDDGSGRYSVKQAYIDQSHFICLPWNREEDSYVVNVTLAKPAPDQPYQDGGTRTEKTAVLERPIMQKVKIVKDIYVNEEGKYEDNTAAVSGHEDGFTQNGGGTENNAKWQPNFRFKAYLKSNLEQLYRAENGTIEWQDRNGNPVDPVGERDSFPEKVQKVFTRVLHRSDVLMKQSREGAVANTQLYGFKDGLINSIQNAGYTAVLEIDQQAVTAEAGKENGGYNYEKFFDAVSVANRDKWDRKNGGSTSFKPFAFIRSLIFGTGGTETAHPAIHNNPQIGNAANTSENAKDNALRSDNVRQFAITWYLDEEVKKLVRNSPSGETEGAGGGGRYQDELYDRALAEAIKKAENYLKPFFSYDLDSIYAIEWDSAPEGGTDKDVTTLSADREDDASEWCYGISEYLPYGTYVAVEQQPSEEEPGDFINRHYKTDAPREIELPAVYEGGREGAEATPERLSDYYTYRADASASEVTAKYLIRFQEEWPGEKDEDLRNYVIQAHGYNGDHEIYKFGLGLKRLAGDTDEDPSGEGHFVITQAEYDPLKDYYNTMVDPETAGGNPDSHYLADDKNRGKTAPSGREYEADAIEKIYRYGSVSEERQSLDVLLSGEHEGDRERVAVMKGMQTAVDGRYAPMLVPWTVTEPVDERNGMVQLPDDSSDYEGYGYRKFRNTFYKSRLRIEKLDSETGESILHDGAIFAIYAADREEGGGTVRFYEKDTLIKGSKEFLEAMGAGQITRTARGLPGAGGLWTGVVPAGTPICSEAHQILLSDTKGRRTGLFEAYTTTRDGLQAKEENDTETSYQDQNTGYLATPQPLGAGAYVLCEIRPPAGYVRTKPIAVKIYSDRVSYYRNGESDDRVAAAIYEEAVGEGLQGSEETARIYVGNTPLRLEVSKVKVRDREVTYRTDTRVEGTEAELKAKYGRDNLEYGYKNGIYLGYAWYKGTLEYLESRKAAGESVEPAYIDGVFAGYGMVTRPLDTAADRNRYVPGARLTLYDAIEIRANGDGGDYGHDGVEVVRDRNNNVLSMRVREGFAGSTVEFVNSDDVEGSLSGNTGEGVWTYRKADRKDTDILFYSLGGLSVTERGSDGRIYGYDRHGNRIQVKNQSSLFALKNGRPAFELVGGDLEKASYSSMDKVFSLSGNTSLYHVDSDGNRDAVVHPTTGMAYTTEMAVDDAGRPYEKMLVWSVNVSKTASGSIIAQEKRKTYRIASINEDTDQEYTIGTYDGAGLINSVNPVVNSHGLSEYYQRSNQLYTKGEPVYDIDRDYVRYRYYDSLPAFNKNAYRMNSREELYEIGEAQDLDDDAKLYHRQGEAWIMENTWLSGEKYPNDPFKADVTAGKTDTLKRVIPGTYILEELEAPAGYRKSLPTGVTVREEMQVQKAELEDERIKVEIVKTDAASQYRIDVIDDSGKKSETTEPKGGYSYGQIAGAHLALYRAHRINTTDTDTYPKGYYLEKAEDRPAEWSVPDPEDNTPVRVIADWISDGKPKYFEGIPAGDYILEEKEASSGYVRYRMELEIKASGEVQTFQMRDDHTKLEVLKYWQDESGNRLPLPNDRAAELALYRAKTAANGEIIVENGRPLYEEEQLIDRWETNDLKAYTEVYEKSRTLMDRIKGFFGLKENESSFLSDFEAAYYEKGEELVRLAWDTKEGKRHADRISSEKTGRSDSVVQLWETDEGKLIRITIYRNPGNGALDGSGRLPLSFEYQFNYRKLAENMKSYDTLEGVHRIDYLPFTNEKDGRMIGNYVLVETKVPEGFEAAEPKAVVIVEKGAVQRFSLKNEERYILVMKLLKGDGKEVPAAGAKLALYRADETGALTADDAHFVERWISGSDGRYTEQDAFDGKIPEGLQAGDIRAHRIDRLSYGDYYIVEEEVPEHMVKAEPMRMTVGAKTGAVCRFINTPAVGRLEIQKTAEDTGKPLDNARFAVKNLDTLAQWQIATGMNGKAVLENLPVGTVMNDGTVRPYTYSIEEIVPPDFYQAAAGVKKFQFDGTQTGNAVTFLFALENKPTEIHFTKTNFATGALTAGAEVAVFAAKVEGTSYEKVGPAIETVVTGTDGFTLTGKLAAGHSYILEEQKAPPGMALSKPVIFTVNKSGTGISSVSNDFNILKYASENGAVEALTVIGRIPVKVSLRLKDLTTGQVLPEITAGGTEAELTADDGIISGHVYEIAEYTRYSDGNRELSGKETRRLYLDEDGCLSLPARISMKTAETLKTESGETVDEWDVEADSREHTIWNPVSEEMKIAEVSSLSGAGGSAVKAGDVMKYRITYHNPYDSPAEVRVEAVLDEKLTYMRSTGGTEREKTVRWILPEVKAHENGVLEVTAAVTGGDGERICTRMKTEAGAVTTACELLNPIATEGSMTVVNGIHGTGKNPEDLFTYQIRFTDSEGKLLKGYQNYGGSLAGRIKGEGSVTIKGNEFLTFPELPYGTRYEVIQAQADGYTGAVVKQSGTITRTMVSAVFRNEKNDETIREVLKAGEGYVLTETTYYSDGTAQRSGRYRFVLNSAGTVDNVDLEDKPIELYFSKIDVDTGEEIAGGHYSLLDAETKEVIYEYSKAGNAAVRIPAELLVPGRDYIFREDLAPAGYAYEDEVRFTVNENGILETVVMQDKKTMVYLEKLDADTGEALAGGRYRVEDKETGEIVWRFAAEGGPVPVEGILTAGRTYELVEEEPPEGYAYCRSIPFTVPEKAETVTVIMRDKKTEVIIEKLTAASPSSAAGEEIQKQRPGFILQILNRDKTPAKALRNFSGFQAGEKLIFTTTDEFKVISGQLKAGEEYWLHEIKPRAGYGYAEDVPFSILKEEGREAVVMLDKPTHVVISKKEITGEEEVPGNRLAVLAEDETVIERWISGDEPHEIVARLEAGKNYYLCEEEPEDGYAFAEKVAFTVSEDGSIDQVEMRNEKTRLRIHKVNSAGADLKGAVLQILEENREQVVLELITAGEPVDVTGKLTAGKTYYLHEKETPSGYLPAADIPFTVPRKRELIEVTMTDLRKEEPEKNTMFLMKTDAVTGEGLEGFEFEVTRPNGKTFTVVTGKGGRAEFAMPPDGTYTYREVKGQAGYLKSEETYSFTILYGRVMDGSVLVIANQPIPDEQPPKTEPRVGRITASYEAKWKGTARQMGIKTGPRPEKTGDEYPISILAAIAVICFAWLLKRRRKSEK